jgi:hypothetical protein
MIRLPTWLYLLLIPIVFLGSCRLSMPPVWRWLEQGWIRPVSATETRDFPVLARSPEGAYIVAYLDTVPAGVRLVQAVSRADEKKINRDLCDGLGWSGEYRYFRVLAEGPAATEVSLEVPTTRNRKTQSWYALRDGAIIPQRMLLYGPGFAFIVMQWSAGVGVACIIIYLLLVRRRKKPNQAPTPMSITSPAAQS